MSIIFPNPSTQIPVNEFSPSSLPEANLQDNFVYIYDSENEVWRSEGWKVFFSTVDPVGEKVLAYEGGLCSRDDLLLASPGTCNPHPGQWIQPENTSPTPPPVQPSPNTTLYWDGEQFIWLAFPVELSLEEAKVHVSSQVNAKAYDLLLPTDWYVTRKAETDIDIPESIASWRADVRASAQLKVAEINLATSISELEAYCESSEFIVWPEQP